MEERWKAIGTLFGMIWLEMLGRQAIELMLTKTAIALVCIMLGVVGLAVAEPRKED